jgi:hypothetical protein
MTSMADAIAAKREAQRRLGQLTGLRGVGITWDGEGNLNVLVNVDSATLPEVRQRLSDSIMGVPVRVEAVGPIKAE